MIKNQHWRCSLNDENLIVWLKTSVTLNLLKQMNVFDFCKRYETIKTVNHLAKPDREFHSSPGLVVTLSLYGLWLCTKSLLYICHRAELNPSHRMKTSYSCQEAPQNFPPNMDPGKLWHDCVFIFYTIKIMLHNRIDRNA